MMNIEHIVELFYRDYYLIEKNNKIPVAFKKIKFDKLRFYIFSNINRINEFKNLDEFIDYFSTKYFQENFSLDSLAKIDYLEIEKKILNITYSFYTNLDRIKILEKSISESLAIKIFGISIFDIYNITALIILRVLLYNDYIYYYKMTSNERLSFFGSVRPKCSFTAEELHKLNSDIDINKINTYLDLFSINLDEISKVEDTKRIINNKNRYVVMFMNEFCTFLFNYCEFCIIDYLFKTDHNKLDDYYDKRGSVFEEYVKNILNIIFSNVLSNAVYIDDKSRKMEIDNLIIEEDVCYNFECKSSNFNIYDLTSSSEVLKKLRKSFGRGYFSIDTFHKTIKNKKEILKLEINNQQKEYNLKGKEIVSFNVTMYPIDFLSTSIHLFDEESNKNIDTFPITINILDLHSIILACSIDKNVFKRYSIERFYSINEMDKLKIDCDEIDAFGYVLDKTLRNGYQMLKGMSSCNYEQHVVIGNSAYRENLNQKLAFYGFNVLADTVLNSTNLKTLKKMIYKRLSS